MERVLALRSLLEALEPQRPELQRPELLLLALLRLPCQPQRRQQQREVLQVVLPSVLPSLPVLPMLVLPQVVVQFLEAVALVLPRRPQLQLKLRRLALLLSVLLVERQSEPLSFLPQSQPQLASGRGTTTKRG